ncbi:unnamed protein product [Caenorhabditis bovis]|uniref:Ephrin RBD domain-containing protein n=1 Tax=Caenorhabditis bovis TaxID=2654633 RepID=A0A8S1F7I6_9PELO|nr:unnamed protein product [Caenorhabditis bovis]
MHVNKDFIATINESNEAFKGVSFKASRDPTIDVRLGDVMRFVCPDNSEGGRAEYLIVYEVSELAYSECIIESTSREVLNCGQESIKFPPKSTSQLIRQFNPIPSGKEFQPGQTYYYITTSTGKLDGIDKINRGLCLSANMRLALKVSPAAPIFPSRPIVPRIEKPESDEDEDSENDSQLLPRDLEKSMKEKNPKFRRPSEFNEAGVHDQQFLKVVQMAKEGKTGTFENAKERATTRPWDPINVQYVSDVLQNTYNDDNLSYQRELDFVIHEDNNVRSLEYSSSTAASTLFLVFAIILLLC